MTTYDHSYWREWDHKVQVPEGVSGDVEVSRFEVEAGSLDNVINALKYGRGTMPGTYTRLDRAGVLWMSDTDAEWRDHLGAVTRIRWGARRVLINGLGLGLVVRAALAVPEVEHVDVVEIDADVIKLVGPTYEGPRCTIHHADAYDIQWPRGTRWDVAWHDIWPTINSDNLPAMARLHRRYGRRTTWQGSWSRELVERLRRQGL